MLFYRDDICLQTLLLLFRYINHKNKKSFVSTANEEGLNGVVAYTVNG